MHWINEWKLKSNQFLVLALGWKASQNLRLKWMHFNVLYKRLFCLSVIVSVLTLMSLLSNLKVKVILQISHSQSVPTPYLKVDSSRKHLTLYDPTLLSSYEQNQRPTAPKMFAFDAIVNSTGSGTTNSNNNSLV